MTVRNSQKALAAVLITPPVIGFICYIINLLVTYDGYCKGLLDAGPKCNLIEYLYDEITHPFIFPWLVMVLFCWICIVGLIHFGIKFIKISKKKII